jgi:hypothetical protein
MNTGSTMMETVDHAMKPAQGAAETAVRVLMTTTSRGHV